MAWGHHHTHRTSPDSSQHVPAVPACLGAFGHSPGARLMGEGRAQGDGRELKRWTVCGYKWKSRIYIALAFSVQRNMPGMVCLGLGIQENVEKL